ncbi:hypothetical protein PQX77_018895 [Marasmius sp. AFHP31]|nr:hypothetical protein PQX77_018895 [Marasmius sp. AFHP31]
MLRRLTTVHLTALRHASSVAKSGAAAAGRSPIANEHRLSAEEKSNIVYRRISKSERDERMDITKALTPIKDYLTQHEPFRTSRWFSSDGSHEQAEVAHENPSPFAYEPHTVFLLESRHLVRYGIGRVDHFEHVVGVCRTAEFEDVIRKYNSADAPGEALQAMDNAQWPWQPQQKLKSVKWLNSNQELQEAQVDSSIPNSSPQVTVSSHGTASAPSDDSWTRPGDAIKASDKDFERQSVQTDAVKHRVSEENLDAIVVELKSRGRKVPFEVELEDGSVAHPSGFVPPTAADKFNDTAMVGSNSPPPPDGKPRRTTAIEDTHSEAVPGIAQWEAIKAREMEEAVLMPDLTESILASGVSADVIPRNAKIPIEIHGVHDGAEAQPIQHPSGFIPPTPKMARGEHDARTTAVEGEAVLSEEAKQLRSRYLATLVEEPFWRPLLAITVSTRPLALSLARLSRGLARDQPFHTSISEEDRKSKVSYPNRLRGLRLDRMQSLTIRLAQILNGAGTDKPISWNKRAVGVAVGDWYPSAGETQEAFKRYSKDIAGPQSEVDKESVLIYGIDEWGKPTDHEVEAKFPWPSMALKFDPPQDVWDAFTERARLRHLLDQDAGNADSQLKVYIPVSGGANQTDGSNLDVPFVAVYGNEPLPSDFDSSKYHLADQPRSILNNRMEALAEKYGKELAQLHAVKGSGVTYTFGRLNEIANERSEDDEERELDLEPENPPKK